jgi:hypothetical protein
MLISIWDGDELTIMEHDSLTNEEIIFLETVDETGITLPKADVYTDLFGSATFLYYEKIPHVTDKRGLAEGLMDLFGKTKYKVVLFYET